MRLYK